MKILFFITSSMEIPSPSWHLMKALLEDTLKAGFEVHAMQRHYNGSTMPSFPSEILNHPNFSYSEIKGRIVDKRNFVARYLVGIEHAIRSIKNYKKNNDYDIVFVQSSASSLYYLLVGRFFAKKRPIIYNSQDMFPGSAIANGSMKNGILAKIFYALQKIAYRQANVITAISEDMKTKLIEQGVPPKQIEVIVNWYDDSVVKEIEWEKNRFVEKYGLDKSKFYVQYAGTMGTNFNPQIILDVAAKLIDEPNIVFQMIGDGVRREKFEKDALKRGLNNIIFYPLQPQALVADVYSACSVCLIPLQRGVIGNSVPSKAGLLMACRRVIINSVDVNSDYAQMFERERIGFSSDISDDEKIVRDIRFLYENPDIKEEYANRAKEYGRREYSRKVNTIKYLELFKQLINK